MTAHLSPELSISPEQYMSSRVLYKLGQYTKKGDRYQACYQLMSSITIIVSASVPVLITLGVPTGVPTLLSLVVTILVSLEKVFHFREHWRNYDAIAASLRSEQVQFQTLSGPYKALASKPRRAFQLFVKNVEQLISEERNDTIEMRTSEPN